MNYTTCSFKRFLTGYLALLLATLSSIQLIFLASSAPVPLQAVMSVELINTNNSTNYQVQIFFKVRDYENANRVRFFDVAFTLLQAPNGTFLEPIEDGSGISLYIPEWHSTEQVQFLVDNISISSDFPIDFSSLRSPKISYEIPDKSFSFTFSGTLTVIGRTCFGTHSVASFHQFNYKDITQPPELRIQSNDYSKGFFIFLYLFMLLIPLSIWSAKSRKRYPLATFVLILLMVFLYAFVGSGREIESMPPFAWNSFKVWPFGFLMHVSDNHIFNNLAIFIPLSFLLEIWLNVRIDWRRFLTWYILPILLGIVLTFPIRGGVGFSITNEFLAWALWSLIIVDRKTRTRLDLLLCIFSGVMALTFFNWMFGYLPYIFSLKASTYWGLKAKVHIILGLIGAFIFALIALATSKEQKSDSNY